jgi:hypothetical protein
MCARAHECAWCVGVLPRVSAERARVWQHSGPQHTLSEEGGWPHAWQADRRECKYYSLQRTSPDRWTAKPLKFSKFNLLQTTAVPYRQLPAGDEPSFPPSSKFSRFGGR